MTTTLKMPLIVLPSGSFASLVQDSQDDITQAVSLVLATTQGERAALPEFGLPSQVGLTQFDENAIEEALNTWEPRASDFTLDPASPDPATNTAVMQVRLGTSSITLTTGV